MKKQKFSSQAEPPCCLSDRDSSPTTSGAPLLGTLQLRRGKVSHGNTPFSAAKAPPGSILEERPRSLASTE